MRKIKWQADGNVLCPFGYKYSTVITVQLLWYVGGGNCEIFPVEDVIILVKMSELRVLTLFQSHN